MNMDTIIVDLQGFKDFENKFIVKELAIAHKEHTQTFLIKPPYAFKTLSNEEKKQIRWLEKNRGLTWSEGYIDYFEFRRVVVPYLRNKKILLKGLEKVKWIQELCQNCDLIELGEKGCPNFKELYNDYNNYNENENKEINCVHHKKMCALKNVLCLKMWCNNNNNNAV